MSASIVSNATEVMGNINHQGGLVFATQGLERGEVGSVGIHRKQPFGHDQDGIFAVACADPTEPASRRRGIKMAVEINVAGGGGGPVL